MIFPSTFSADPLPDDSQPEKKPGSAESGSSICFKPSSSTEGGRGGAGGGGGGIVDTYAITQSAKAAIMTVTRMHQLDIGLDRLAKTYQ